VSGEIICIAYPKPLAEEQFNIECNEGDKGEVELRGPRRVKHVKRASDVRKVLYILNPHHHTDPVGQAKGRGGHTHSQTLYAFQRREHQEARNKGAQGQGVVSVQADVMSQLGE
jgi:hypothetical protein